MTKARIYILVLIVFAVFPVLLYADSSPSNPFHMKDGLLVVEVESAPPADEWEIGTALSGASGQYYHWNYPSARANAGEGVLEYHVYIPDAGRYRFQLRSARGPIDDNTEENDVFARVTGSGSEAIGIKKSTGDQVSMGNSWFKVYQNSSDQSWSWTTHHVDNNAHQVFFDFDAAGVYVVGLSGRSQKFNIDRWVLYDDSEVTEGTATNLNNSESTQGEPGPTSSPTDEPTATESPTATETPTPTDEPTATNEPPPTGEPPNTPPTLSVDPNNGRPIITWPKDDQSLWFNFWIIGTEGQGIVSTWLPLDAENVPYGNTVDNKAQCPGMTCTAKPEFNLTGGSYALWMRTWGNDGYSIGGNSQYEGWSTVNFEQPTTPPGPVSSLTATVGNTVTLSWQGAERALWYNVWVGTDGDATPAWQPSFFAWMLAEHLGCEGGGICTLSNGVDTTVGAANLNLSAGEYIWYVQSWGPGGFSTGGSFDPPLSSWVEASKFTVP